MEAKTTLSAKKSEDGEYEKWGAFDTKMRDALAPIIKKYLVDFFGERLYDLESETYRAIDENITKEFVFGDRIAYNLNTYRTIIDDELWDDAYNNFDRKEAKFAWQVVYPWDGTVNEYNKDLVIKIPQSEENKKLQKELAENVCVGDIFLEPARYTTYLHQGRDLLIPAIQKYIEDTASFDLTILSLKGYMLLQYDLEKITYNIFDSLFEIIEEKEEG